MPEANDKELNETLKEVLTVVTGMRAELDGMKKFKGRTSNDVLDEDKVNRMNRRVGERQKVLDEGRRAIRRHRRWSASEPPAPSAIRRRAAATSFLACLAGAR